MIKTITYETIKNANTIPTNTLPIRGENFEVVGIISDDERISFINDVVNECFIGDEYSPENYAGAVRVNTIKYFTNIDIESYYENSTCTTYRDIDVYDLIRDYINHAFYKDCLSAIREKIKYRRDELLNLNTKEVKKLIADMTEATKVSKAFTDKTSPDDLKKLFEEIGKIDEMKKLFDSSSKLASNIATMEKGKKKR